MNRFRVLLYLSTVLLGIVPVPSYTLSMKTSVSSRLSLSTSSSSARQFTSTVSTSSSSSTSFSSMTDTLTASPPDPNCPLPPRNLYPLPSPYPQSLQTVLATINSTTYTTLMHSSLVNISGYSYQLYYGNQLLTNVSMGIANRSSSLPWSSSTPSRIASVTKIFSTILLAQFVSRGYLTSWNEEVTKTCPSFGILDPFTYPTVSIDNLQPTSGSITWKHLSSHLAGIQREIVNGFNTTVQALQYMNSSLLIAPPATTPSYSNVGFSILGHLLANCVYPQTKDGQAYLQSLNLSYAYDPTIRLVSEDTIDLLPSLVEKFILRPLNLSDTFYYNTSSLPSSLLERLAVGYLPDGSSLPSMDYNLYWDYPAGQGIASVEDLVQLQQTLLTATLSTGNGNHNKLNISSIIARELFQPVVRVGDGTYLQGLPWEIRPRGLNFTGVTTNSTNAGCASFTVFNKGGNLPGYTALIATVPLWNITIAGLFNGNIDEFSWSDMVMDNLLPIIGSIVTNFEPYPAGNPGPRSSSFYEGVYTNNQGFGEVEIVPVDNSLLFKYIEPNGGILSFFMNYFTHSGSINNSNTVAALRATNANITLDIFQASLPPFNQLPANSFSCTNDVTLGLLHQYIYFYLPLVNGTPGTSVAVSMPGYIPGAVFLRQ